MNKEVLHQLHELADVIEGALASTRLMIKAISEKVRCNENGCQRYEMEINNNLRYVYDNTTELYNRFSQCKSELSKCESSSIEDEILQEFSSAIRAKKIHLELKSISEKALAAMKTLQTFNDNIEELLV